MKIKIFFLVALILSSSIYFFPKTFPENTSFKYFRVDKIVSVTGKILKIRTEKSYHKRIFIILDLQEKKERKLYKIEVSPQWFYNLDLIEGNIIKVKGSLIKSKKGIILMAQSITFEGEIFNFRDRNGFPLWRGDRRDKGMMMMKGERKRKGKH